MNEQTNINVEKLRPFTRLLMTIGELPTSYLMSMTYLEQVTWFCNYLQKTVIPVVNNNAQAVEELQNIINNLDIQDEVDTKLDEMAESGQLTDIIAQYLDLAGVLAYNTIADLKNAENIVKGSICKTLGYETYNDGHGAFYKIRAVTTSDVVDNFNIVRITNDNTLVGERIPNYLENEVNNLNRLINKKYLFVGDSYAVGYQGENVSPIDGFFTKVKNDLNLNATIIAENGYGFLGINNNLKWKNLIENSNITDKESYTDIIICGGMNDSISDSLTTEMTNCFNYLKQNFVNAKIHVGMIGAYKFSSNENLRRIINLYFTYKNICLNNGISFLENSNYLLRKTTWFISDNIHPNTQGENYLAYGIKQYILNNYINFNLPNELLTISPENNIDLSLFNIYNALENNFIRILFNGRISFSTPISISNLSTIKLGTLLDSYIKGSPDNQGINATFTGYIYTQNLVNNSHFVKVQFVLYNDSNGGIYLKAFTVMDNGDFLSLTNVTEINIVNGLESKIIPTRYC